MTGTSSDGEAPRLRRRAVDTAAEVFERILAEVDAQTMSAAPRRLIGSEWGQLYGRVVEPALARLVDAFDRGTWRAPDGRTGAPPITISARPGEAAVAFVWIHNCTELPVDETELLLTPLSSNDGPMLPVRPAVFEPARVQVPPQGSARVRLSLAVPPSTPDGVYHGHVLARGLPETNLPIQLMVRS